MKVGHIYIVNTVLSRPKKDKITLCICASDNLFLWINTNPRRNREGQMPLLESDHKALSHDCFLDCSKITTFPPEELGSALERDCISEELTQKIVSFLSDSPPNTLVKAQIELILGNLSALYS